MFSHLSTLQEGNNLKPFINYMAIQMSSKNCLIIEKILIIYSFWKREMFQRPLKSQYRIQTTFGMWNFNWNDLYKLHLNVEGLCSWLICCHIGFFFFLFVIFGDIFWAPIAFQFYHFYPECVSETKWEVLEINRILVFCVLV